MATCLACNTSADTPGPCPCGFWAIDTDIAVTVTLPVEALRMVCGMAERFVAVTDPAHRGGAAAALYRVVDDLVTANPDVGPLTITGAVAAASVAEWSA